MNNKFNIKLFFRLLEFVKPYKPNFIFVTIAAILISVFSILSQYLLKIGVDDYITLKNYSGLVYIISLMFAVLIFQVIFQFLFVYFTNILGQKVVFDIRTKLFSRIIKFKMSYYDKSSVGRLVTRSVNDMETIASIFSQGLFMIFADLILMLSVISVMIYLSLKLSIIVFAVLPFILIATRFFQRAMKSAFNEVRSEVANLNSFVQERISGIKEIQIFNREEVEQNSFVKINEKHKNAWLKTVWYNSIFFPIAEISTSITIGLLVWFGGRLVGVEFSGVTIGTIFLFIQLSQMLFRPLRQIADKFNTLQMGMVAANRVFKILDTSDFIKNYGTKKNNLIEGKIKFDELSFSYSDSKPVFDKLNLSINSGEKVAIVGSTGSGKTTLINLILRFYESNSGNIFIDNRNIKDIDLKNLRSQISLVTQDIFLFADSIFNNITLFNPNISIDDVKKAAKEYIFFANGLDEQSHERLKQMVLNLDQRLTPDKKAKAKEIRDEINYQLKQQHISNWAKSTDEDETVFSGPGEEEARKKGEIMRKDISEQPGAEIAPDLGNQPGPNYTNQPSLPKVAYKRKSKVLQPGIRETDV